MRLTRYVFGIAMLLAFCLTSFSTAFASPMQMVLPDKSIEFLLAEPSDPLVPLVYKRAFEEKRWLYDNATALELKRAPSKQIRSRNQKLVWSYLHDSRYHRSRYRLNQQL